MTKSTVKPNQITIIPGKRAKVYLAKDIAETTETQMDTQQTIFTYNEVVFEIDNRENLQQSIESNFELYWQYGEQQMQYAKDIAEKQQQLHQLIDKMTLVDELAKANQLLGDLASLQLGV